MDLELGTKGLGVDGESLEILVEPGRLAILFPEDDLVVDQVQEGRGPDPREVGSLQIGLDPDPLPAPPAIPVILHQGERHRLAVAGLRGDMEPRFVSLGWLMLGNPPPG